MNIQEHLNLYYSRLEEVYRIECIGALLGWDQQVYLPLRAASARANQIEYISILYHQKTTDPEYARAVNELFDASDKLSEDDRVNIRESKRNLDIESRLPSDFIAEMAQADSIGYSTWAEAMPKNDFEAVRPCLERIIRNKRREADYLGYQDNPYDPLLDLYEPGATSAFVKPLLLDLAEQLRKIIPPITDQFRDLGKLPGHYNQEKQYELCRRIIRDLGFNFDSGRLDTAPHPFMTSIGPSDFRVTARWDESDFIMALYGAIHETGHALYEMGLPADRVGTPLGTAVSLGIHESQSRLWENIVGRSREFVQYLSGIIAEYFPEQANTLVPGRLWHYVNRVEPSLIRTEADEVTYSQHIVIRMILEEALLKNDLGVADLPGAWDDLYEKYLGIRPPDYKSGVMQDMHWYSGLVGYFPTYALGNLFNSMMMDSALEAVPDIPARIERGEFTGLLGWLHENVHRYGMRYRSRDLIKHITGRELTADSFVNYLKKKYLGD